ncbi:MAG TPA: hypothetical protein ENK31_09535, partial [Nannocystis exedens]|nr:hypothetical protein [Nannocystis exedens]
MTNDENRSADEALADEAVGESAPRSDGDPAVDGSAAVAETNEPHETDQAQEARTEEAEIEAIDGSEPEVTEEADEIDGSEPEVTDEADEIDEIAANEGVEGVGTDEAPVEIHNAVSDALADALAEDDVDAGTSMSGEVVLPPPPDRSGVSFAAYSEEEDEGPEFLDESMGSAADWRARLGTAIAVADLDEEEEPQVSGDGLEVYDDDEEEPLSAALSNSNLAVYDDDEDEPLEAPSGAVHTDPGISEESSSEGDRSPRPRALWISESRESADFYGAPFPLDRWQRADNLIDYVVRGRYRLTRSLGRGDSFRVFLAERMDGGGAVVVKLLGPDYPPTEERAELFRSEARRMAQLDDPRVVEVIDIGTTRDGLSYVVIERLEGPSLSEFIEGEGPLPWAKASSIVCQVLEVTVSLHAQGHTHRTIHPDNIYITGERDGVPEIRLTNVGLTPLVTHYRRDDGKLAVTPEGLLGSAEYMAPEVVSGNLPDVQSDVYAAGVLLYELLAGRPPFLGQSLMGLLKKHLYETPASLRATVYAAEIPDGIEGVLFKALEKDPAMRYSGIAEFAAELTAAELRQRELTRTKGLLSAVDAALWGDDEESLAEIVEQQPVSNRRTLHEVPISPLTDEDLSAEERESRDASASMAAAVVAMPAASDPAVAEQASSAASANDDSDSDNTGRTLILAVAIVALLAILFILTRPGGTPKATDAELRASGAS